jgi:hypothetical protein
MTNQPDLESLFLIITPNVRYYNLYMDKFLQTSNFHSLCVSHAFLMYHLYDGRIGSSEPKKYGHKEDGISGFCSHQHSTGRHLKICFFSIEMSHNHPRNK